MRYRCGFEMKGLSVFKAKKAMVRRRAISLLPDDCCHADKHYCQQNGCPFNTRRAGHAGRCVEGSNYCIWHDDDAMDTSWETHEGREAVRCAPSLLKRTGALYDGDSLWKRALDVLP